MLLFRGLLGFRTTRSKGPVCSPAEGCIPKISRVTYDTWEYFLGMGILRVKDSTCT